MKSANLPVTITQKDSAYPRNLLRFLGDAAPEAITLRGNSNLLFRPKGKALAFFCSAKSPASVLLAVQDLAHQWRKQRQLIISGFHSPAEQEVLDVLLHGTSSIIICPARGIGKMRMKPIWKKPMKEGRLLLLSPFSDDVKRPTKKNAVLRNRFIASLADEILIAWAEPGSKTEQLAQQITKFQKTVYMLEHGQTVNLHRLGFCQYPLEQET